MEYLSKLLSILVGIKEYVGLVIFGGIGGIVYLMLSGKDIKVTTVCRSFFVSAFSGLLAGMMIQHFGLDILVSFVVSGLAGFAGGVTLIWILTYFNKKAGLQSEEDIERLRAGINKDAPAECVLTTLIKQGHIGIRELKTIIDGDLSCLIILVSNGALDGLCFEAIARWQRSISSVDPTAIDHKELEDMVCDINTKQLVNKKGIQWADEK